MARTQNFWTYQVTNTTLLIDESFGLGMVSVMLTSGSATVNGGGSAGSFSSNNLALTIGMPVTFGGSSPLPIDGLTISAPSGNVYVIGR